MYDVTSSHMMSLDVKLPIASQANHKRSGSSDEKPETALVPEEAVAWLRALRKGGRVIKNIDICGPGDALASSGITFACLELLLPEENGADLSLTCLGFAASGLAADLARLGVKTVNLLVDTVNVETAIKLYAWLRPGKKTVPLAEAAKILVRDQAAAVKNLRAAGIRVVIRTVLVPDVNDREVSAIAEKMAGLGVAAMEISGAGELDLEKLSKLASVHLPATTRQAATELPLPGMPGSCSEMKISGPSVERPNVAVVSSNGMDVDMHLGHAGQVLIYGPRDDGLVCLLMARQTQVGGGGSNRWKALEKGCLHDCFALLATHAGEAPRKELTELGIQVILTEDNIEGLIDVLYGGGKKKKCEK